MPLEVAVFAIEMADQLLPGIIVIEKPQEVAEFARGLQVNVCKESHLEEI